MGLFNFFSSDSLSYDEQVIFSRIRPVIADLLAIDPSEIQPNSRLGEDLGCDELDVMEIMLECCKIGYSTPPKSERGVRTVRDIIRLIKRYL